MFIPALFRVGLTDRIELRLEGNTFTADDQDHQWSNGVAPTSIGFEWQLRRAAGRRPGLGVIGRYAPEWGRGEFASHHVTGDARLSASWDIADRWSLNPNVGIAWYEGEEGDFRAGLFAMTLAYEPADGLSLFVDTGVQSPEADGGSTSVVFDAGVAYSPKPNWQVDLSAGTRAHGQTAPRPFVAIGFAYRHKL